MNIYKGRGGGREERRGRRKLNIWLAPGASSIWSDWKWVQTPGMIEERTLHYSVGMPNSVVWDRSAAIGIYIGLRTLLQDLISWHLNSNTFCSITIDRAQSVHNNREAGTISRNKCCNQTNPNTELQTRAILSYVRRVTEEFRLKLPSFRQHRWVNHKSHMHFLNNSFGVRLNRSINSMEQGPSWEANSSSAS